METWPSTLPYPLSNVSRKPDLSTLRSKDSQAPAQRMRFRYQNQTYSVSWFFDGAQFEAFETFFQDTLHGGSDWFTLPLPQPGNGVQNLTARFTGGYKHGHTGVMGWEVSAEVETKVSPVVLSAPAPQD